MRRDPRRGQGVRRLLRILFAAFAGVSLLLCLATGALWVRSYLVADQLQGDTGQLEWKWVTRRGWLQTDRWDGDPRRFRPNGRTTFGHVWPGPAYSTERPPRAFLLERPWVNARWDLAL